MKKNPTALESMDEINRRWWRLRTLSELLTLCETAPGEDADGRMVSYAAGMMMEELDGMRPHLETLNRKMPR